jgi:ATP-dependent exoDNAse (exonuclease V) alpha subunit
VQSVAYATKEKIYEDRRGLTADYRTSKQEVSWETMTPACSGIDKKDLSFWNKLDTYEDEYAEKRYKTSESIERYKNSARTAQSYVLALPKELSEVQNIYLLREFCQQRFVDRGLMITWAIHWEEGNPHAHVNVSTRTVWNGEISWTKQVSRELDGTLGIRETRKIYANIINKYQEMIGIKDRVDPLSFAERGIELIPTQHKGYKSHQLERDGLFSRIGKDNEQISEANKERIAAEPGIIIKELSSIQATFSEMDIIRLMQKRLKDDIGVLGDHVFHGVMKDVVEVGTGIDNSRRYTSQEYFEKEVAILESFEGYQANKSTIKIDSDKVEELLNRLEEEDKEKGFKPNQGQINGIKTLCGDNQLSVLIGRAGTGKTTTMSAVVQLHKEAGFNLIGMAPSATAASQLEADTGCKSDTLAHYAYYWKKYDEAIELLHSATTDEEMGEAQKAIDKYKNHLPTSETVIIVDEAGMVGVGDRKGDIPGGWDAITKIIDSTGAKLILTGDDHQFKPVEAGDVFRKFVHLLREAIQQGVDVQFGELTEIKRQTVDWMREVSGHLSELNVATALGVYENKGHIKEHASNEEVFKDIAQQYLQYVTRQPDSKGIVIAATNEERLALNREIRNLLKDNGLLPKEDLLQHGEDGYTVGDRIVFTKNDRGWNTKFKSKKEGFFVQNSMQAVIHSIKPVRRVDEETGEVTQTSQIVANTFDDKGHITATIWFNLNEYKHFTPGYAVTGWKSQGNTLDWVIAKLSRYMDAHALYVIATRHREEISMHYSKEDFADYKAMVSSLSRANVKDLVVDYSVSDENKEYWQNVQDYKDTGRELLGIRTLARSLDKENKEELKAVWENYREVEADRKSWAKFILGDWEDHKDFARQAGLTKESLEIAAGLTKRTLSRVEREAQQTVEQYVEASLEARTLWRDIRRTHPGSRARLHPEWPKFEAARDQRGVIANLIHINPILHRPYLKETADNLAKADIG